MLEYSQRLGNRARNVMASARGSTGRALYEAALAGGAAALGAPGGGLAAGAPADLLSLDLSQPAFCGRTGDALLDSWIFATTGPPVDCVWVAGRKLVERGRHRDREAIAARFRKAMAQLGGG